MTAIETQKQRTAERKAAREHIAAVCRQRLTLSLAQALEGVTDPELRRHGMDAFGAGLRDAWDAEFGLAMRQSAFGRLCHVPRFVGSKTVSADGLPDQVFGDAGRGPSGDRGGAL
jgi:hypothetical protein